jgi:hypothetical protein
LFTGGTSRVGSTATAIGSQVDETWYGRGAVEKKIPGIAKSGGPHIYIRISAGIIVFPSRHTKYNAVPEYLDSGISQRPFVNKRKLWSIKYLYPFP